MVVVKNMTVEDNLIHISKAKTTKINLHLSVNVKKMEGSMRNEQSDSLESIFSGLSQHDEDKQSHLRVEGEGHHLVQHDHETLRTQKMRADSPRRQLVCVCVCVSWTHPWVTH